MIKDQGSEPIRQQLKEIFALIFDMKPEAVSDQASVDTIEKWDSLQHMTLTTAIEQEFGVRFPLEEVINLRDLPSIEAALREKLDSK